MFVELRELLCSGAIRRYQLKSKVQKAARACTMRLLMGLFNRCKSNKKWVGIKQKEKE